jgi:hypothetical protein
MSGRERHNISIASFSNWLREVEYATKMMGSQESNTSLVIALLFEVWWIF